MSKKSERKLSRASVAENVFKSKLIVYLVPFILVFFLLGIVAGFVIGVVDISALIPGNADQDAASDYENVYLEYVSDELDPVYQYSIKPDGEHSITNNVFKMPYDGSAKSFKLVYADGTPVEDDSYTFTYTDSNGVTVDPVAIGTYTVVASNDAGDRIERRFEITMGSLESLLSGVVKFEDVTVDYDGQPHSIQVEGELPEGITLYYNTDTTAIDAGEYKVTAVFMKDANYNVFTMEATLTINKIQFPFEVIFNDKTVDYNKGAHALEPEILNDNIGSAYNISVKYTNKATGETVLAPTDAGVYEAVATIESDNYTSDPETPFVATLTINKIEDTEGIYASAIDFANSTLAYDKGEHTITPVLKELAAQYGIEIISGEEVTYTDAGEYKISASFSSTNYVDRTITVVLTIEKADFNYAENGFVFADKTVVYNTKTQTIELVCPEVMPEGVADLEIIPGDDNEQINAGVYNASVTIKSKNYNDATLTATFTIEKAKITKPEQTPTYPYNETKQVFRYAEKPFGIELEYGDVSGSVVPGTYTVHVYFKGNENVEPFDEDIEYKIVKGTYETNFGKDEVVTKVYDALAYIVTYPTINDLPATGKFDIKTGDVNFIDVGEYEVTVTIIDKNGYYEDYVKSYTLVITEGAAFPGSDSITVNNKNSFSYNGDPKVPGGNYKNFAGATVTHTFFDSEGNMLDAAINAGEYRVITTISVPNYAPKVIESTMTIKKGSFNLSVLSVQKVPFDMKNHLPKIDNIPEGATVTYYSGENITEGAKNIGTSVIKVVIENANQRSVYNVSMKITINPIFILMTAAVGLVFGIVLGLICYVFYRKKINVTKQFADVNEDLTKNGKILAESFAKTGSGLGKGRLYFTGSAIKFYSRKYRRNPDKYISIDVDKVRSVNCIGSNEIDIYIKNDVYKFVVPAGAAKSWADTLINY